MTNDERLKAIKDNLKAHYASVEDQAWLVAEVERMASEADDIREALGGAVFLVDEHVGCGDSACRFVEPKGMATNGGCRCERRPFAMSALAGLYKAVKEALGSEKA